jgi:hypothetical protein
LSLTIWTLFFQQVIIIETSDLRKMYQVGMAHACRDCLDQDFIVGNLRDGDFFDTEATIFLPGRSAS